MHNTRQGLKFDINEIVIFVTPILAACCLMLLMAAQGNGTLNQEKALFNDQQFIIMTKTCYLKTP